MNRKTSELGQGTTEYALLLALMSIVVISVVSLFGSPLKSLLNDVVLGVSDPQKYAEVQAARENSKIKEISVKRLTNGDLKIDAQVTKPLELTITTSDNHRSAAACMDSCTIVVSGIADSAGVATVHSTGENQISVEYPSKLISVIFQPKNILMGAGSASFFVICLYLLKTLGWKVSVTFASKLAVLGKSETALKIFLQLHNSGRSLEIWRHLYTAEHWFRGATPEQLLPLYQLMTSISHDLSVSIRLESFTKLGCLYNDLLDYKNSLSLLERAYRLYGSGVLGFKPETSLFLLTGLGKAQVHASGDKIRNLAKASAYFEEARNTSRTEHINDELLVGTVAEGFKEIGDQLVAERQRRKAWGVAKIENVENENTLFLNRSYTLVAGMAWEKPRVYQDQTSKMVPIILPEIPEPFAFDISVWADSMEIKPTWCKQIELSPNTLVPELKEFQLIPKQTGSQSVTVNYYYQRHLLQQLEFQVEVIDKLKIGMLLGMDGLGDNLQHDLVHAGMGPGEDSVYLDVDFAQSGTLEQNTEKLGFWAKEDYDLIIAFGEEHVTAVTKVAAAFPAKAFALIDAEVRGSNIWCAEFDTYELDVLIGELAALVAGDSNIGFIGESGKASIQKVEAAFVEGIRKANPNATSISVPVEKFDEELKVNAIVKYMFVNQQISVLYQAAGRSGIGAIKALDQLRRIKLRDVAKNAEMKEKWAKFTPVIVTTGEDYGSIWPDVVITSRVKNLTCPVHDVIRAIFEKEFRGNHTELYNFTNGGVSLAPAREAVYQYLSTNIELQENFLDRRQKMEEIINGCTTELTAGDTHPTIAENRPTRKYEIEVEQKPSLGWVIANNTDILINISLSYKRVDIIASGQKSSLTIDILPATCMDFSKNLQATFESIVNESNLKMQKDNIVNLAMLGHSAFNAIFDARVQATLLDLISWFDNPVIEIFSDDFFFPWELLYLGDINQPAIEEFLGFRCILTRSLSVEHISPPKVPVASPKIGLLVDPAYTSIEQKEIPYFEKLKKRNFISLEKLPRLNPDQRQIEMQRFSSFLQQNFDVLHFACHAEYDALSPIKSSIKLADDFSITLLEIDNYVGKILEQPLIVLNTCRLGTIDPSYTTHFVTALLKKGALGVVAVGYNIPDDFAAAFIQKLYEYLLAGAPLGYSVFEAKRFFWTQQRNPAGLFYTIYGPPSIQLTKRRG
jgi:basic membrane protein A and related proteins